jgi:hypothetical protein
MTSETRPPFCAPPCSGGGGPASLALAAPVDLNGPGHYLDWSFVQISAANLIVLAVIALAFVAALLLPFPGRRGEDD